MKKILFALLAASCMAFVACGQPSESAVSSIDDFSSRIENIELSSSSTTVRSKVLAHWKFQNVEGCYTGNIDTDDLTFIDLTGNGNHLVVEDEGYGEELDIFTWDTGVVGEGSTSLKFNNTLALAESVDPFDKALTTYSGAYVSGKYLETVSNAPINMFSGEDGWTIEIVLKISSNWNNGYNRYTGIFSRQGIVENEDEPYFSMALSSVDTSNVGAVGTDTPVGFQIIHTNNYGMLSNREFGSVKAETWVHYMVVGTGNRIISYINGVEVDNYAKDSSLLVSDYRWEVGVGRKLGKNEQSMNEMYAEGLIRRLFCGSISEIRFPAEELSIADSLWPSLNN